MRASFFVVAVLSASLALADDLKTISGKEYKNVTVSVIRPRVPQQPRIIGCGWNTKSDHKNSNQ
jgi:hypothetical protein